MNFKMILAAAILTIARSNVVCATEQSLGWIFADVKSTEICSQPKLDEQTKVLCERITQLRNLTNDSNRIGFNMQTVALTGILSTWLIGFGYLTYKYRPFGYLVAGTTVTMYAFILFMSLFAGKTIINCLEKC